MILVSHRSPLIQRLRELNKINYFIYYTHNYVPMESAPQPHSHMNTLPLYCLNDIYNIFQTYPWGSLLLLCEGPLMCCSYSHASRPKPILEASILSMGHSELKEIYVQKGQIWLDIHFHGQTLAIFWEVTTFLRPSQLFVLDAATAYVCQTCHILHAWPCC